jgi:lipopolysaccharide transport system ATP-binding protein
LSDAIIEVRGLSKRYRLGELERLYSSSFREMLMNLAKAPWRRLRGAHRERSHAEAFWALKDVSFDVRRGDVLGVVGRNGAGKSTLLKVLSRITAPTKGEAIVKGSISSLLEVGTGFHPELTGRENVFLNGTILGMRRTEIKRRFDEIVAFAEVEKFLDTPVKRYSSGMYLRLAFAVAAHLDSEILLIDEVLAVGDVAFQRKCLTKMNDVSRQGRTILFVSHNTAAIQQLCPMCLWIDNGEIKAHAETPVVYDMYLASIDKVETDTWTIVPENPAKAGQLLKMGITDDKGRFTRNLSCDHTVIVEMQYVLRRRVAGLYGYFQISHEDGTPVMVSISDDVYPNPLDDLSPGAHRIRVAIPPRTLGHGRYRVTFATADPAGALVDAPGPLCLFELDDLTTQRGNRRGGFFSTVLDWQVARATE